MKRFVKFLILFLTIFNVFTLFSCYNKYIEISVPVEKYRVINDGGSFGTTVIEFYVSEDFEYDLDLLKDIKIKFSYRPENALTNKTVIETGKVDDFIGSDDSYFYVNIKNRVATYIDNPVEVKNVTAKIEKRFINSEESDDKNEKETIFGIGESFIFGLICSIIAFGFVFLGSGALDETKGQVIYSLGYIIPIVFTIFTFLRVGIWQGIIITIFSLLEIIGAIAYTVKR
jgi:hypothetical protein